MEIAGDDITLDGIEFEAIRIDRVELDAAGGWNPVAVLALARRRRRS